MKVTIIESSSIDGKFPLSTTGKSNEYLFKNEKCTSMRQIADTISKHFVLNFPLDIEEPLVSERTKIALQKYYAQRSNIMILSFDGVFTVKERDDIIRFLMPYKSVFFASKSTDNVFNNNFKGVIAVDNFTQHEIKRAVKFLQNHLTSNGFKCSIETSFGRGAQFTAPTTQNVIYRCEEIGAAITRKDIKDYEFSKTIKGWKPEIYVYANELFEELGFIPLTRTGGDKVDYEYQPTNTKGYTWYPGSPFNLWHNNPSKNIDIGVEFRRRFKVKDFVEKYTVEELIQPDKDMNAIITKIIQTDNIQPKDLNPGWQIWSREPTVIALRSPMGTGKTSLIIQALQTNPNSLVITPRVSLAAELKERIGSDIYFKDKRVESMVCQFDSLHKFDLRIYDSFILDEFMTLESHIVNPANKSYMDDNIQRLVGILSNERNKLLIMDALLTENVLDYFEDKDVFWVTNKYKDPSPLITHKTLESFLKELSTSMNRKITVSCVSKDRIESIKEFLERYEHRVCTISSDTSIFDRENILKDFKSDKFTALVYTPSISVGINILGDVDRHFHFDPGRIVSPIQSIQMMKRARNAEQIDCYIGNTLEPAIIGLEEIKRQLVKNPSKAQYYEINGFGESKVNEIGKIYCRMLQHNNIWRSDPRESFTYLASLNFNVTPNIEVLGSKEFKGRLNKTRTNTPDVWDNNLRSEIIERFGDKLFIIEQYLKPDELKDFIEFNKLKRSYDDSIFRDKMFSEAYIEGNFNFKKDFEEFTRIYDNKRETLDRKYVKSIGLTKAIRFGFEKSDGLLGNFKSLKKNKTFEKLYDEIWNKS